MAKLALTVGGAFLGFMIGGPFGAQIGAMIGGAVGNILFAPTIKGPRLTDLTVTASTYGQVIPELYGTMRLGGNMIWTAGIKEKKKKSGGKGGPKQITYTYSASFAIAFCKGEIDDVLRLWADGKALAGSKGTEDTGLLTGLSGILHLTGSKKSKVKYRVYTGGEDQLPDSVIQAKEGAGKTPAYRGLCYILFQDMPLADYGNRIPQITAEITRNPVPKTPYALFNDDPTKTATSVNYGDVDWVKNRFYKYNAATQEIVHYDLRTMEEIHRVQVALWTRFDGFIGGPQNQKPSFSIGGAYMFDDLPYGNNSGTVGIWDAWTGALVMVIGALSGTNNLEESPIGEGDHPFLLDWAICNHRGSSEWFRILNGDGSWANYVVNRGNTSSHASIWTPGGVPIFYWDTPGSDASDCTFIRGKEDPGAIVSGGVANSDLHYVITNGTQIELQTVNVTSLAVMQFPIVSYGPTMWGNANTPLGATTTTTMIGPMFPGDTALGVSNVAYDASDNSLVIWGSEGFGGDWRMGKWLISEGEWKWTKRPEDFQPESTYLTNSGNNATPGQLATQSRLDGGKMAWITQGNITYAHRMYVLDLQTGKLDVPIPFDFSFNYESHLGQQAYDDYTNSIIGGPERFWIIPNGDGISLQTIVDDVLLRTRALEVGDFDTDELAPIFLKGYVIARETSARDVLNQLASAYFFDGVESDYKIKCKLRGGAPVGTITEKHLGWAKDRDITLAETRAQELDLPMRVTISYSDPDRDYQEAAQSAKRNTLPIPTMHSKMEQKFELPIAMSATECKQIADKALKMAWANRVSYNMKWPWEFLKYDPADVLNVISDEGNTYLLRIGKTDLGVDFNIAAEGISEKAAAYTSVAIGSPGTGVPDFDLGIGGDCDLFILNTPLLRDVDDTQGIASTYFVTAKAQSPGTFNGCYLFESPEGTTYEDIDYLTIEPTWGVVNEALPSHATLSLDTTTVLTVKVMSVDDDFEPDTLESVTDDDLLVGKNAAMIGNEIIQFKTATLQPDGKTYLLTGLLRARRGTNYAVPYHTTGERFILLDPSTMITAVNSPSEWSSTHYFKAVAVGTFEEDAIPMSLAMEPNDLKPYTPEVVTCGDNATTVTINFERRSRITSELVDGTEVVPYKEGQGSLAHFVYKVYANKDLTDTPWVGDTPDFTGQVPIFSGVTYAPLTFQFAMAGITEFVVEIYEVGFVDGFPKIVHFKRVLLNDWDKTELY